MRRRVSAWVGTGAVALVAVVLAVLVGAGHPAAEPDVPDAGVDAGFARDMSAHHAQAVDLATIVRERGSDPRIRAIALDIALTQQEQIGRMQGWLVAWGLTSRGTGPQMSWMAGHHGDGDRSTMPGMATGEEVASLRSATGPDADRLFVRLMVRHHRGGVVMAGEAVRRARVGYVRDLARRMEQNQQVEIADLLAAARPLR